ncbi:hypothetical protein LZ023_33640 [Pseudomonas silvicola]|nr:hypothetical protein LZ023_33640 [Pseudomonas silvicola]
MKRSARLLTLMAFILLSACHSTPPTPDAQAPAPSTQGATPASTSSAITPRVQLQKPQDVLASVNKNYSEITTSCKQYGTSADRGLYYCSGVTLRTVDDGAFNPWAYSPTAVAIGATSYSWIRQDTGINNLYHPAGFILRNKVDAIAAGLPGLDTGFICMYPYDAWTTTVNGHQGCGLKPRIIKPQAGNDNGAYAWGSCDAIGVTTTAQWNADFRARAQNLEKQCSWNIDKPSAWVSMISSRNTFGRRDVWTEILLNNYNNGNSMPRYIAAFFYDPRKAGGLTAAQNFQRKLNAAGYSVPILRLQFDLPLGAFSYVAADQAVPQSQ